MEIMSVLEFLKELVVLVWSYDGVKIIVSHTVINVVIALAAAQKTGEVNFSKLSEFLTKKLLPYVSVYFTVKLCGEAAGLAFLAPIAWTAIEVSLTGDLLDSMAKLGLQLPSKLAAFVVKD